MHYSISRSRDLGFHQPGRRIAVDRPSPGSTVQIGKVLIVKIDVHGHVTAPDSLYVYKAGLVSHRGAHGRGDAALTAETANAALDAPSRSFGGLSHRQHLDNSGVDYQLISPRPYQLMHSESPAKIVQWFAEETNKAIALSCEVEPTVPRASPGCRRAMETSPASWMEELRRCVTEYGFVGAMLNPDPYEGLQQPPALGDRFWYPVWEALCELDVPAVIHSAGCRPPARETYSLHFIQEETVAVTEPAVSPACSRTSLT